jgi:hypothetical protein
MITQQVNYFSQCGVLYTDTYNYTAFYVGEDVELASKKSHGHLV